MKETLERIVPEVAAREGIAGDDTLALHVARYAFARRFARGRVLDIACGVGYGTQMLAEGASVEEVVGVDISAEALAIARERYMHAKARFEQADCMAYGEGEGFDTVVSLETVEHLNDPAAFVRRMAGMLTRGGMLVASVPVTPSMDFNPYHLHDFSERGFERTLRGAGLEVVDRLKQEQRYQALAALRRKEARMADARRSLSRYYLRHPGKLMLRIASVARDGFLNRYLTLACKKG